MVVIVFGCSVGYMMTLCNVEALQKTAVKTIFVFVLLCVSDAIILLLFGTVVMTV